MTTTPEPLDPELLDELVSADLDGEFDAACADLGLDPAGARDRIAATPGSGERRAALAAARDALAEPVPVDDVLAARLRAQARTAAGTGTAARRGARTRVLGAIAAAAAVVVVVAGAAAVVRRDDRPTVSQAGRAPAGTEGEMRATSGSGAIDFGAVADPAALAAAVRTASGIDTAADDPAVNAAENISEENTAGANESAVAACEAAAVAAAGPGGGPVVVRGTATVAGAPAEVFGLVVFGPAADGGADGLRLVVTSGPPACAVLYQEVVGPPAG